MTAKNTAPCDDCGKPVPVPDDWPIDWTYCDACRATGRADRERTVTVDTIAVRTPTYDRDLAHSQPVTVAVTLDPTIPEWPGFRLRGYSTDYVRAMRDRIRAAFLNAGYAWPLGLVDVDVTAGADRWSAPSRLTERGLDLAVALAILAGTDQAPEPSGTVPAAYLALDGSVQDQPTTLADFAEPSGRYCAHCGADMDGNDPCQPWCPRTSNDWTESQLLAAWQPESS